MRNQKNTWRYGSILLVFFAANLIWAGSHDASYFKQLFSNVGQSYSLFSAPSNQETTYPQPPTLPPQNGYPGQPTVTEAAGNTPTSSQEPGTDQTPVNTPIASETPAETSGESPVPSTTSGSPNDIFLTENAEMGQSQATHLPSETLPPTETQPASAVVLPAIASGAEPNQNFQMDWGGFSIGFLAVVLVGGGIGWWLLKKRTR